MDEKKIHVIINKTDVELESNNPDLKKLVNVIITQDENFDFNNIEIKIDDDNFDKNSFKEILLNSILEFKENLKRIDIKKKNLEQKINSLEEIIKK